MDDAPTEHVPFSRQTMQAFHLDSVDSTNEEAKRLILAGRITGPAYILAREQTAGKGNHGRFWHSPKDAGVYVSVVDFAPTGAPPASALFTLAAGVACANVLREPTALEVRLKPINDLYLEGRKLGGILVESMVEVGTLRAVVTGVGINTHRADRPLPDSRVPAISLEDVMSASEFAGLDFRTIVANLVRAISSWNATCWTNQPERVRASWLRLALPGARCPI